MKTSSVLFVVSAMVVSANVNSATINFTGTLGYIYTDNGSSTYSGNNIGDSFSGSFTYGDSSSDASSISIVSPISADYAFTGALYGGVITDGSTVMSGLNSSVGIGNDDTMGDDATTINDLYGAGSTTAGTIADTWSVDSSNSNQFFGLTLYSLDTALFTGLGFQVFPPAFSNSDFALFYIQETDVSGNTTYLATGKLGSISAVPIPAAAWLFVSGLAGLFGMVGYRSRS